MGTSHLRGEANRDIQGVQPQRIDLDRFADPRREYPVAVFGVHPGQLGSGLSRPTQHAATPDDQQLEQAVGGIDMNSIAGAIAMRVNDGHQDREQVAGEIGIALRPQVVVQCLEHP